MLSKILLFIFPAMLYVNLLHAGGTDTTLYKKSSVEMSFTTKDTAKRYHRYSTAFFHHSGIDIKSYEWKPEYKAINVTINFIERTHRKQVGVTIGGITVLGAGLSFIIASGFMIHPKDQTSYTQSRSLLVYGATSLISIPLFVFHGILQTKNQKELRYLKETLLMNGRQDLIVAKKNKKEPPKKPKRKKHK